MKNNVSTKIISVILTLVMVICIIPSTALTASAANREVFGMIYASQLNSKDILTLGGDTTLYVDVDITLGGILGDYSLEIIGNKTLTVTSSIVPIKVSSLEVKTDLVVKSSNKKNFAIYSEGDVKFNGTNLKVESAAGICSANGNVDLTGNISINAKYVDGIVAENGNIKLNGKIDVCAEKYAIHTLNGNIDINGSLLAMNNDENTYCIVSDRGDISLTGGKMEVSCESNAIVALKGNVNLDTIIYINVLDRAACAINARGGDINVLGGYIDVRRDVKYTLYAYEGNLNIASDMMIVMPENAEVKNSTIMENGFYAKYVKIFTAVNKVNLYVNSVIDGDKIPTEVKDVYGCGENVYVESLTWYEDDVAVEDGNKTFMPEKNYRVELVLKTQEGCIFKDGAFATLNSKSVEETLNDEKNTMTISYDFGECMPIIDTVELLVKAPVEGENASYGVSTKSDAYYVVGQNSSQYYDYVNWLVSDDGVNYKFMTPGDKFIEGKYYKVQVDVHTNSRYSFKLDDKTGNPDVLAFVNGHPAKAIEAYEQIPENYITILFDFGVCNDSLIESIVITDVVEPVAGESPSYKANTFGSGYLIDIESEAYDEEYVGVNAGTKYYYKINGIRWYDVTADDYVYENDKFIAGHEYKIWIDVFTEDGYEFLFDSYTDEYATAIVNGNIGEIKLDGSNLMFNQCVFASFICKPKEVTSLSVSDIAQPVAGRKPDFSLSVELPDVYMADTRYGTNESGIYWYDNEGNMLEPDDEFVEGVKYKVEIKFVPVTVDGAVAGKFVNPISGIVNGYEVVANDDWDNVYANSSSAYIYYTFSEALPEGSDNLIVTSSADKSNVCVNDKVTITAKAIGGVAPYTYSYIVHNKTTGKWNRIKDKSTSNTYTWTAGSVGERAFYVDVTDAEGITVRCKEIMVITTDAPLSSKISTDVTNVAVGAEVTFKAQAAGGSGPYKYSYIVYNKTTKKWARLADKVASSTYKWTANSEGEREFFVDVTDSSGATVRSESVKVVTSQKVELSATSKADKTETIIGDKVIITSTPVGGTAPYKYSYIVYNKTTKKWSRIADKIASNTYTWTAGSEGEREFYVDVTDATGKTVRCDAITIVTKNAELSAKVTSDVSKVKTGDTVTFTVTASGGNSPYTYSFIVYNRKTKQWSRIVNESKSNTYTWKAGSAAQRVFCVDVKDSTGKVVRTEGIEINVE